MKDLPDFVSIESYEFKYNDDTCDQHDEAFPNANGPWRIALHSDRSALCGRRFNFSLVGCIRGHGRIQQPK